MTVLENGNEHGPEADEDGRAGRAAEVLRRVFGYDAFRGEQQAIVEHVIAGGDALVLMPTGGGKSLCYQIPALVREGVGVVVSPLIALMQDQVDALRALGVRAGFLNSTQDPDERRLVEAEFLAGELDLLYLAPERLRSEATMRLLERGTVSVFAIDEAHCVAQWGHDFRRDYLELSVLHERWPSVPRIALTATATQATRQEIAARLELTDARHFVAGFDRPNIQYRIAPKNDPKKQLLELVRGEHAGEAGIVYCLSRASVEKTAEFLVRQGIDALPYHAGLDAPVRAAHQARFLREDGLVMVATIAFGMGIDKPDVRFVAHLDLPRSLEAYYQETGRAGRDGLPAEAWMIFGMGDIVTQRQFIEASGAPDRQKQIERQKLNALMGYVESARCRRQTLLAYFGDRCEPCGNCDSCLEPADCYDGTELAQKALSCVYRTEQRYGAGHVIDVLVGEATDKVVRAGHDQVSTFGIGKDVSKAEWRSIFRQLVALELLTADADGYGSLKLGPDCRAVLRGERRVELRRDPAAPRGRAKGEKRKAPGSGLVEGPADAALFDRLRARRMELARAQGVPPYVIFHDSTLAEMARRRPRDSLALSTVPGVGAAKLARYGDAFLAVINDAGPEAA